MYNKTKTSRHTLMSDTTFGNWKPFTNDEKCFYVMLKALFVLKIFKFLSWLFGHVEKGWIRNIWLISKSMTSQPG